MKIIMSTLSMAGGLFFGFFGFLYLVWRRLKEDYSSHEIFSLAFLTITFAIVGYFLGLVFSSRLVRTGIFNPREIWFWLSVVFGLTGFIFSIYKFKMRFYESFEAVVKGFLFFLMAIFIFNALLNSNLVLLVFGTFLGILVYSFRLVDSRYKSFTWYKSGKVGFSGLAISGVFFLVRTIIALIFPNTLSFIGSVDAILSAIATFLSFVALYNLSGR